jgi:hypothetical protein
VGGPREYDDHLVRVFVGLLRGNRSPDHLCEAVLTDRRRSRSTIGTADLPPSVAGSGRFVEGALKFIRLEREKGFGGVAIR